MFQKLVSHNHDIRRLVEKGYAVGFANGYLIVRDVPYLDAARNLQFGAIVAKLQFVDGNRVCQTDHQVYFAGTVPHGIDGRPIPNLGGGAVRLSLGEDIKDVIVQRSFSNKPRATGKFADFYDKIDSYVGIISGPAMELHQANPLTFRVVTDAPKTVFKFSDTLTSRAEITELSELFKDDVIAIIGLGGTGSYVLDFMAKTPVREIRAFDLDPFQVHNAFRSPGRLDPQEFGKPKAEVHRSRYENFRSGVSATSKFVDANCAEDLCGVNFAFVCVDRGPSRSGIFDLLLGMSIPFIDVGMGLKRASNGLNGMIRVTYYSVIDGVALRNKQLAELAESPNDLYRTNIQISELNALNAALAVLRYKQLRGFYAEEPSYLHLLFDVGDSKTVGATRLDEI